MFRKAHSIRVLTVLSILFSLLAVPAVFAQSSGAIDATTALSREDVGQAMQAQADARGISIDTETLVYASRDDITIVNAGIVGVENLGETDLAAGADVTFVYIASNDLAPIADGFYTLPATSGPDGTNGFGELVAADGSVAYATGGSISDRESPSPGI